MQIEKLSTHTHEADNQFQSNEVSTKLSKEIVQFSNIESFLTNEPNKSEIIKSLDVENKEVDFHAMQLDMSNDIEEREQGTFDFGDTKSLLNSFTQTDSVNIANMANSVECIQDSEQNQFSNVEKASPEFQENLRKGVTENEISPNQLVILPHQPLDDNLKVYFSFMYYIHCLHSCQFSCH